MEVGAKVEEVDYRDTPSSFLEFYRNLVVHMKKKGALTHEEIISKMDKIIPKFLMCVHEVLFYHHIYITVGQDLTVEEEKEKEKFIFHVLFRFSSFAWCCHPITRST